MAVPITSSDSTFSGIEVKAHLMHLLESKHKVLHQQ